MNVKRLSVSVLIIVLIGFLLPITVQASHRVGPDNQTLEEGTPWTATVVVYRLNVRRAPRINSNIVGKLNLSDKVTLTGRTFSAAWLQIQWKNGYGWIAQEFIRIDSGDSRFGLPIARVIPPSLSVTAQPSVNVRQGPSELYPVVTQLPLMLDVDLIAIHSHPLWYEIAMPGEGPVGWVRGDTVEVTGDAHSVPEADGIPMAQVTSYRVHVHTAPLLSAPVLGDVEFNQIYQIVGLDARRNWWQIKTPWGPGWILNEFVQVFGGLEGLPETMTVPLNQQ